ncbi:virion morphogenesis protein [Sulfitobacter pseudonitzschiae]|uniref:Virion morphogenesis protein n=1 Tax=Pseudosulfitobacter pseudonitzschiae TaxID=1402135 RepID=A0A9Q2NMQ7_9RHOB|nr:virion morphogenesis protein [Pseudosulfitobacter pseudonitzschiae]MBM2299635.1 virion morphogenesis protein [Pseudosulfitobacter pseudonitzschiae]MBM2304528.1 virion morphogenesis protein [Pseudosulfitobacter pseudonitzschiae]MBM2314309.1 virion morphogenesis protein [Pseudosulfitobacter pseudonitzschiae]MBM2319219.1 virion morphogenesis protein [Pseudosulfitobacter pseudonitzschiae]
MRHWRSKVAEPLGATFGQPFPEQVAAFRLRLGDLVPTSRWDDIRKSAHDRAFVVAGATKADLLADLGKAVDAAIAEGESLEQFRGRFREIVKTRGWHGWTGEGTKGGEAWRTKVIYRTNMATSYAAGRRAQLISGNYPFWVYRHGGSENPRLTHLSWDGLVLPPDHPFWITHTPVNDWGCSCYILGARSERAARRLGGDPDKKLPDNWQKLDPKTGEPVGIGKGWGYAPGGTVPETVTRLADKLESLPPRPSIDLIQEWLKSTGFAEWMKNPIGNWPLARIPDSAAEAIGAQTRVAHLSPQTRTKQLRDHPELSPAEYALAQTTIDGATHRIQDGPRNLIFVRDAKDARGYVLVIKATQTGQGLLITSFRRLSQQQAKKDQELRRLLRKGV